MKAMIKELLNQSNAPQCVIYEDVIIMRNVAFNKLAKLSNHNDEIPMSTILSYQSMEEWVLETNHSPIHLTIKHAVLDQDYMLYTFEADNKTEDIRLSLVTKDYTKKLRWLTDEDGKIIDGSAVGREFLDVHDSIWSFVPKELMSKDMKKQVITFYYQHTEYEVRIITYYGYILFDVINAKQRVEQLIARNELINILELSNECYILHDDMTIHYANKAAHLYLGVEEEEQLLTGRPLRQHIQARELKLIKESVRNQQEEILFRPVKLINGEGSLLYTMCAILPVHIEGKKLYISVLKQSHRSSKKREEAMKVASRLSASMAHEIRNPLTTIKGFMQLYKEMKTIPESQLAVIDEELEQMEKIINDYVFLAQQKGMKPSETIEMNDYLQSFMKKDEIQALTQHNPVAISSAESFYFNGYKEELDLLFLNLIENAVDASEKTSTIEIRVTSEQNQLCVQIIDKGVGISPNRLYLLGQPFFSSKEKGTGLGLMICHKIAELHGGRMEIKTKAGTGTIVHIYLPLKVTTAVEDEGVRTPPLQALKRNESQTVISIGQR
ncbi:MULTISPECIES: sensor histidine kinase [Shouchella]|uniref:histidine kinase n=2 Tax=Shouchella TaxID=2893057 RepID=A0ABY7W6G3_9BACI|nr:MULTISPECIES: HAMP domain-containing sensor histidine kinase [Shouchella]MED4127956.1 HAMP domain-containing sensor histidine kinase [Shouchella miscanthi]WDF03101.1 HAMP domain-containing sensor histidine kinase [Shouchella hunanensis]